MNSADKCRANGWTVGTRLIGTEGDGRRWTSTNLIEITAIGETEILAKCIEHNGKLHPCSEASWALQHRDWQRVDPASVGWGDGMDRQQERRRYEDALDIIIEEGQEIEKLKAKLKEKDQTIAVLEKALVLALEANFENPDAVAYYIHQAEVALGIEPVQATKTNFTMAECHCGGKYIAEFYRECPFCAERKSERSDGADPASVG